MFNDIGRKIKTLAIFTCILLIGLCVVMAFYEIRMTTSTLEHAVNLTNDEQDIYITAALIRAALWLIIGPIVAWISCFVLYGFGELVESNTDMRDDIRIIKNSIAAPDDDEQDYEEYIEYDDSVQ